MKATLLLAKNLPGCIIASFIKFDFLGSVLARNALKLKIYFLSPKESALNIHKIFSASRYSRFPLSFLCVDYFDNES